jgi:hypothetical protein
VKDKDAEDEARLPTALKRLIADIRHELKIVGDDGAGRGVRKRVLVQAGWPEVYAIYALSQTVHEARRSRETWKSRAVQRGRTADVEAGLPPDVRALLRHVEHLLTGEETSDRALRETLRQVRALARSKT